MIDRETIQALTTADRAAKQCWPVAGGWLDQAQTCLDAVELIESETAQWRAARG